MNDWTSSGKNVQHELKNTTLSALRFKKRISLSQVQITVLHLIS